MMKNILALIRDKEGKFSKSHKLIADFIKNNYQKAAFMTAAKLGQTVNVSESTVVRFAFLIGFDGYPKMQQALKEMIKNRLTSIERMEVGNEQLASHQLLDDVLNHDIIRIKRTLEETSRVHFNKAVQSICDAKTIYIIGAGSAGAIAGFIYYYFNLMFKNVKFIQTASKFEMLELMFRVSEEDVVIGISFPRYSTSTVLALDFAKKNNATVIGITDSYNSPIAALSDCLLTASFDMASFVDSLVAPLSLINALIIAVSQSKGEEVRSILSTMETLWKDYNVYEGDDDLLEGEETRKDLI